MNTTATFDPIADQVLFEYPVYFKATKLDAENDVMVVEGTVGYDFDTTRIRLLYNRAAHTVTVDSGYRVTGLRPENASFRSMFDYTGTNMHDHLNGGDSMPYYRFPRSKDGIPIPQLVSGIFGTEPLPRLLVPCALYAYAPFAPSGTR
jgi:hypothetical protein